MAWFFAPLDNLCIDCEAFVIITTRNYIVWSRKHKGYKRQCAECHDAQQRVGRRNRKPLTFKAATPKLGEGETKEKSE